VIKVKIKHPGAHFQSGKELRELEVGEVLEIKGDELPNFLIGKAEILGDNEGKVLATNDDLLESAMEENKQLLDQLNAAKAELEKVPALLADLDAANAEIAELKKPKSGK
jgi:hypothetical protein